MGQAQSDDARPVEENNAEPPPSTSSSSIGSLIAEAAAYGNDENESIEARAKKALECPCVADLRKGECGNQFSEAFYCFLKSTTEEKGSDCVHPFVALQSCIKANPNAYSKEVMGGDLVKKDEASPPEYRIIPPTWSLESQGPRSRL